MDWNHQGVWAVGAALAGGLLGVIATSMSTSSVERMANAPYAERIREAELEIDRLAEAVSAMRSDFAAQEDSLKDLHVNLPDSASLASLRTQVQSLSEEVAQLSEAPASAPSVDAEAVAKLLVANYAESIRGPAGNDGAPGPQGVPGPKGDPGVAGPKGAVDKMEEISGDLFEKVVTEAADRAMKRLNENAAGQVMSQESSDNSSGVTLVGAMDCLELDRGKAVTVADFKVGGSACFNGVPVFQVKKLAGCTAYFAHSGSTNDRMDPGDQDKFFISGEYVGISYSCDSNAVDDAVDKLIRVRLHWLGE